MRPLTDPEALRRNRIRAGRQGPVSFLHDAVSLDLQERLKEVNKSFTDSAIIAGRPQPEFDGPRIADTPSLGLSPAAHDLVVSFLVMHWADDPVGHLIQMRRALRPDGLALVALFGGETLTELRACLAEAEVELTGGLSPRIAPMAEIRDLGGLLQRAGLALPVADSRRFTVRYADAFALMHDLRGMGEGNALSDRLRRPTRRAVLQRAAELYRKNYPDGGGIRATFEVITLTGWAPAETQPKPLRPGSATTRLADALGVSETPLPRQSD